MLVRINHHQPEQLHLLVARGFDRISGAVPDLPRRHGGVRRHGPETFIIAPHDGDRPRNRHFRSGGIFQPGNILFRGECPVIRIPVDRNADQRRFRRRIAGYRHFGPVAERKAHAVLRLGQRPHFRLRHGSGQRLQRDQARIQVFDLLQQFGRGGGTGLSPSGSEAPDSLLQPPRSSAQEQITNNFFIIPCFLVNGSICSVRKGQTSRRIPRRQKQA